MGAPHPVFLSHGCAAQWRSLIHSRACAGTDRETRAVRPDLGGPASRSRGRGTRLVPVGSSRIRLDDPSRHERTGDPAGEDDARPVYARQCLTAPRGLSACLWRLYYTRYYTRAVISTSQPTGALIQCRTGLPRLGYEMSVPGGTHLARAIANAFSRPDRIARCRVGTRRLRHCTICALSIYVRGRGRLTRWTAARCVAARRFPVRTRQDVPRAAGDVRPYPASLSRGLSAGGV